jgi:hypothetical protein
MEGSAAPACSYFFGQSQKFCRRHGIRRAPAVTQIRPFVLAFTPSALAAELVHCLRGRKGAMETLHPIQRFDLPTPSFNYSTYTLAELFKERYWVDVRTEPNRIRALEQEIEKRCAHIRERATQTRFSPTSMSRFKPYGLISGVLVLLICTGPFVALELLDLINLLSDAHADLVGLSGVWALLTLPLVIIAFVMGTVRDAERVVNWFDLAGR